MDGRTACALKVMLGSWRARSDATDLTSSIIP